MSLESAIQHLLKAKRISAPSQSYAKDNPNEYAKVKAYLEGGPRPTGVTTEMGVGLVEVEDERRELQPEPPSPSTAYFIENFGLIKRPPWESIQTMSGAVGPISGGQTQDASGRLSFGAAPDGMGRASRFEIRDSDPGWPPAPNVDRTQLQASVQATWNAPALQVGDVRWFEVEFYLPNEFDFVRDPNWNSYVGIHPGTATGWGCFNISVDYQNDPAWMTFKVGGGSPVGTLANLKYINLFQLTNANGTPYAPNRNRRIPVVYGGRFAPDNTGWLEIWVDGVNIFPRTNRPTMWVGDTGSYFKIGPYKDKAPKFPSGKTIMYVTKLTIGNDKPL